MCHSRAHVDGRSDDGSTRAHHSSTDRRIGTQLIEFEPITSGVSVSSPFVPCAMHTAALIFFDWFFDTANELLLPFPSRTAISLFDFTFRQIFINSLISLMDMV